MNMARHTLRSVAKSLVALSLESGKGKSTSVQLDLEHRCPYPTVG